VKRMRGVAARAGLVDTAFFLVLMAMASATLWPIYQTPRLIVLAGVGLALGAALAWLGALLRWPGYLVFGASLATFVVVGVPLAVPDRTIAGVLPSFEGVRDLVVASALGWKQLLTVDLPISSYQALLTPALVLVLGGAVLGLSLLLRTKRGQLAVLVPIAVAISGIALGPLNAWNPIPLGVAFLVWSILWMTWRARRARRNAVELLSAESESESDARATDVQPVDRRGAVRPVLAAIVVLTIAVAGGVTAASALAPQGQRDVLRASIERPFDPRDYSSPLSGFRAYWNPQNLDTTLFTINGVPDGARIRLATLDTYDGVVYSVGDDQADSAAGFFGRVPSMIDRTGEPGERITADVVVSGYRGVWLPTVGDIERVEFHGSRDSKLADSFYVNRTTGTAAVLGGVHEGDSYTMETVVPSALSDEELLDARPGTASVPTPVGVPDAISEAVEERTAGLDSPGEKLAAVVRSIRDSGYISHGTDETKPYSRSGHAADRIARLLTEPLMLGDGEQYATAVALMANELGFPARVVMGFEPRAGETRVTGADVAAWVEVDLADDGWVALDVTPDDKPIPEQLPDATEQVSRPRVVIPPPPAADDTPIEPNRPDANDRPNEPVDGFWPLVLGIVRVVGVAALVALILAMPLIVVGTAKVMRRRRRRRRVDTASRIAGGWQELVDTGLDYGHEVPASATRLEFAKIIDEVDLGGLARRADAAVFDDNGVPSQAADDYWAELAAVRASWASEHTRRERLRAAISTRSLRAGRPASKTEGRRV
jgi:transglutaminase-like putative cysteine protease